MTIPSAVYKEALLTDLTNEDLIKELHRRAVHEDAIRSAYYQLDAIADAMTA